MGKLKNNQSGFSAVEVVLVIVIVALIGTVGWLVYKNHHKTPVATVTTTSASKPATSTKTTTTTSTTSTTTNPYAGWGSYTPSDNVYTVNYPSTWATDPDCAAGKSCSSSAEVDTYLNPSTDPTGQTVLTSHVQTSSSAQGWFDNFENIPSSPYSCVYNTNSTSINGYQTYYAELYAVTDLSDKTCPTTPPATAFSAGDVSDNYVLVHNSQAVWLQTTLTSTTASVTTFNQIANSVKFN